MSAPETRPGIDPRTDKLLGDLFKDNAPSVDEQALRERVTARGRAKRRGRRTAHRARTAAVACTAAVVLAAVGYAAYATVDHFQTRPVLVLTDSTSSTAASSAITSPVVSDSPEIQAQVALMTGAPVVLTAGGKSFTLSPQEITAALVSAPLSGEQAPPTLHLSAAKLSAFFARVAAEVEVAAVDATFKSDGSKVWVVPGRDGSAIDAQRTADALTEAALMTTTRSSAAIMKATQPELTTAEAEALGVKDTLAGYTTTYQGPADRTANVKLASQFAGGVLLAPGEQYDLDKLIGPRTASRGWHVAAGIVGPNQLEDILGGGLHQVATTVFNAAYEAGLEIVERHNISIYISHYPKGRDAALTGGGKDLRFTNDTGHYIYVAGISDGVTTSFTIFGTDDGRTVQTSVSDFYDVQPMGTVTTKDPRLKTGVTSVAEAGQTGRSVKVTRVVTRDGTVIHDDVFISLWPMYPETIAIGIGK